MSPEMRMKIGDPAERARVAEHNELIRQEQALQRFPEGVQRFARGFGEVFPGITHALRGFPKSSELSPTVPVEITPTPTPIQSGPAHLETNPTSSQ